MTNEKYDIGMVGLGVMGRNLTLNIADHGFSVAGFDKDPSKLQEFRDKGAKHRVVGVESIEELVSILRSPRAIMLLVPAGPPVDAVILSMLQLLDPGDIIIDGGNSHFTDTNVRINALNYKGIHLCGVGISGGEHGARFGPSMMPGGPKEAYERIRPIFEAIAAKVDGEPCVTYIGPGSAGHYVKMVHNGIEYGLMQLIAESYDLMKRGLGMTDDEMHSTFDQWNQGKLNSFLLEITALILLRVDDRTGKRLVDIILDEANQKGTGKWTSQDAMDLQVPITVIDAAVSARDLSAYKTEREAASRIINGPEKTIQCERDIFVDQLRNALYAAAIITYAQGMVQLKCASSSHKFNLNLEDIAGIWRGGCIIRSSLLKSIKEAYRQNPDIPNLLVSSLGTEVEELQSDLRAIVCAAAKAGVPIPGFMAALAYFDGYRSAWLPANLTQAQRDYFGAHAYERVDAKGVFHTVWEIY